MLTEQTHTEPQWPSLSGRILEGGYELGELAEVDESGAKFRVRVLGDRSLDAFVHVLRGEGSAAEQQVGVWEAAQKLQHPNLSTPLAVGRTQLDGVDLIYVVLRKPEETLSSALAVRALTAKEAGEVLASVSRGLEHLLQNGLVHGCVSPEQILAVGDSVQLTTACIRRAGAEPPMELRKAKYAAPESGGMNVTPAADVWCVGATIFEALTQQECGEKCGEQAARLPQPFAAIVERCLAADPQSRCELGEALTLYKAHQAPVPQPARTPVAQPISRPVLKPASVPARPGRTREVEERRASMLWVYAAIAAVVVLVVVWAELPKHASKVSIAPVPAHNAEPAAKPRAWETRTLPADGGVAKAAPNPRLNAAPSRPEAALPRDRAAEDRGARTINGQVWRVVLFTYNREPDAQNRVRVLNEKHPKLAAEVFTPNPHGGPYLVTASGPMSHDAAARVRQRALSQGMPRDSYIQNYKQ